MKSLDIFSVNLEIRLVQARLPQYRGKCAVGYFFPWRGDNYCFVIFTKFFMATGLVNLNKSFL